MQLMVLVKANKDSEAGVMPTEELLTDMDKYNEELVKAGVLLAAEGLQSSSKGTRVNFPGDKRTVIYGLFPETKELVAGFWLIQVKSLSEAIEWSSVAPTRSAGSRRSRFARCSRRRTSVRTSPPNSGRKRSACARRWPQSTNRGVPHWAKNCRLMPASIGALMCGWMPTHSNHCQDHVSSSVNQMIRIFMHFEVATFIAAFLIHSGVLMAGYEHYQARIAEGVIALVLLAAVTSTWISPAWTRKAGLAAQAFALLGTLIGVCFIAVGVGPRTVPDIAYHVTGLWPGHCQARCA